MIVAREYCASSENAMRIRYRLPEKQIAFALALLLVVPSVNAAQAASIERQPLAGAPTVAPETNPANQPASASPQAGTPQPAAGNSPSPSPRPEQSSPQTGTPQPVGTAAAPAGKALGVAASRPAGAVIAPAKQRRARSYLIRVGIVIGACVAVGTVVALSKASPSTPH